MESNNPKEFWTIINTMRNFGSETNDSSDNIEVSKWLHHFKTLFRNEVGSSKPENDSQKAAVKRKTIIPIFLI